MPPPLRTAPDHTSACTRVAAPGLGTGVAEDGIFTCTQHPPRAVRATVANCRRIGATGHEAMQRRLLHQQPRPMHAGCRPRASAPVTVSGVRASTAGRAAGLCGCGGRGACIRGNGVNLGCCACSARGRDRAAGPTLCHLALAGDAWLRTPSRRSAAASTHAKAEK